VRWRSGLEIPASPTARRSKERCDSKTPRWGPRGSRSGSRTPCRSCRRRRP